MTMYDKKSKKNMCIITFFDDSFQYSLKEKSFGESRFENTLNNYKNLFLLHIKNIGNSKGNDNCSMCKHADKCIFNKKCTSEYIKFLNEFAEDLANKYDYINELFDDIINIYITAIGINRIQAFNLLNKYIKTKCDNYNINSAISFSKPLFRVRKIGDYDPENIYELFHVPFSRRYVIGNQRYGLAGIPCLYVSESIEVALEETGVNIDEANAAIYVPKYSSYYHEGVCNITNEIFANLIAIKKFIFQGSKIEYNNEHFSFSKVTIERCLARFVLSQILQFPVQKNYSDVFTQEYVIPQLLMDIVTVEKWKGIIYNSSKKITYNCRTDDYNYINENICFTIPYNNENYNDEILNNFYYATWKNGGIMYKYEDVLLKIKKLEALITKGNNDGYNMSDYGIYVGYIKSHIDCMEKSIGKHEYRNGKFGKVELTLFYKLMEVIEPIVKEPQKYGIVTYDYLRSNPL